jgi:hypothetical protein
MTITSPIININDIIPNFNYLFLQTYPDSARYMLSTIVQSEAAIFALVVTLSLIAVQLAASSFSTRIIEIFKKTPDVWTLIIIYISLLIYGLAVLKLIESNDKNISNFEYYISLDYRLSIFAFLAIIPYIWNILDLLKPSNIIDKLSDEITKDRVLSVNQLGDENDPIQPITDILISSLMRYDECTIMYGLKAIVSKLEIIFKEFNSKDICDEKIVFQHLSLIGKLAVEKRDDQATVCTIAAIGQIGVITAERYFEEAAFQAILGVGEIGVRANKQNMEYVSIWAVDVLGKIGISAVEGKFKNNAALQAILYAVNIGTNTAEISLVVTIKHAMISIRSIGIKASENSQKDLVLMATSSLEKMGLVSIESGFESEAIAVSESIEVITIASLEHNLESEATFALNLIGVLGTNAAEKKLTEMTSKSLIGLKKIGEKAIERKKEETASIAIIGLECIGIASAKQMLGETVKQSISQIKLLQILAKENKLMNIDILGNKSINKIYGAIIFDKKDK